MESNGTDRRTGYANGILSSQLDRSRAGCSVLHADHRHYSKQFSDVFCDFSPPLILIFTYARLVVFNEYL